MKRGKRIISVLLLIPILVSGFIVANFLLTAQPFIDDFRTSPQSFAATVEWDGGGNGVTWEDGANWNPDGVPDDTDDVLIDSSTTVNINAATTINSLTLGNSGGTTSPILNFNYDANGTSNNLDIDDGDLTVHPSATITHKEGTTTIGGRIDIDVQTGNALINGSIQADGDGYKDGEGPGAGTDDAGGCGGGSFGGVGGTGQDDKTGAPGEVYGSITQPIQPGSGGGICGTSVTGRGGGAIKLTVDGTITVGGLITANGIVGGSEAGGGSGGAIWIDAGTVAGTGTIRANGGDGHISGHAGAGGGGRIAIYYTSLTMSNTLFQAYGGTEVLAKAGAGTILLKNSSLTNPSLIIDNNNYDPADDRFMGKTKLTPTSTSLSLALETLEIRNEGYLDLTSDTTITYNTLTWNDDGNIADNGGSLAAINASTAVTIPSGATLFANTPKTWTSLSVSGTVTHSSNGLYSAGKEYEIDITAGSVTVNSGGAINADTRGYGASQGPGAGTINAGGPGGGSYGGVGGTGDTDGDGTPGEVYGSITVPVDPGSGGATQTAVSANNLGSSGGGVIQIEVTSPGTLTVNGSITSNGETVGTNNYAAGSGGSIAIQAVTIAGTGTITANGGTPGNSTIHPGGGGGGRIALYFDSMTMSNTNIYAAGGQATGRTESTGGAGTVYLKPSSGTADLILDNRDLEPNLAVGDRWIGRTKLTPTSTPLSLTVDELIIRNDAILDLTSDTTLTYTTLTWDDNGQIADNGGSMAALNTSAAVTIPATAKLYANTTKSWSSLTVNGMLTHSNNNLESEGEVYKIDITTSGNITVASTGTINVEGRGYDANQGPGNGVLSSSGAGGASYGGVGGTGAVGAAGEVYGSISAPTNIGSGGGWNSTVATIAASRGGGAVKLTSSGTVTVNGPVTANYRNSGSNGGASGGSVYIIASTLAGSSTITADGGDGGFSTVTPHGSGGGGRIAIYYDTLTLSNQNIHAYGGRNSNDTERLGGAGTVYLKDNAATYPDLIVDNNDYYTTDYNDRYLGRTKLTPTSTPLSITFDEVIVRDKGNLELNSDLTLSYSTLTWLDGVITDNGGTAAAGLTSGDLVVPTDGILFANLARTFSSATINGVLTHSGNLTSETYTVDITTTGNLTIASSGSINVDGNGYTSASGPGAGADEGGWGSGAGHGGVGGDTADAGVDGGATYDSETAPVNIGSGGGNDGTALFQRGSNGGGAVYLEVGGNMTLSGTITADALDAVYTDTGGGSGGAIWVTITGMLSGSGSMSANGGSAEEANAGAGAGGRIRYECSTSAFAGTVTVDPGSIGGTAGTGTISEACSVSNDPIVVSVKVATTSNGANVTPLSLTAGTTTTYYINGTLSDLDGYTDITDADARLYRSGATGGVACTADNNDCYIQTTCSLTNGSGNTVDYSCQVDIQYFADPTDTGTYSAETWNVRVSVTDTSTTIHDDTYTNEVNSLLAVSIPGDVSHGALSLGQVNDGVSLTATNVGNTNADLDISMASPMSCDMGSIPIANNKYDLTNVSYASMSNTLSSTPATLDVDLPQQTNDSTAVSDNIYWGIQVPTTDILGDCSGTLIITAT